MSSRPYSDFPRNEAGLVDNFLGSAYDVVKGVYDNLPLFYKFEEALDKIDTLAEEAVDKFLDVAMIPIRSELATAIQQANAEVIKAQEFADAAALSAEQAAGAVFNGIRTPEAIPVLPIAAQRAMKLLAFDADGKPWAQPVDEVVAGLVRNIDLASPDKDKGAAFISRGNQICGSVTELRSLLGSSASKNAFLTGYYKPGDGGGGPYYIDPEDSTSEDNGVTIIRGTDDTRWKLATLGGCITGRQAGARVGTGLNYATQNSICLQNAINSAQDAGLYLMLDGVFETNQTLIMDCSTSEYFIDPRKIDIRGTGMNNSRIKYLGTGVALKIQGGNNGTLLSSQMFIELSNFGVEGTYVMNSTGILQDTAQHVRMTCVDIMAFDILLDLLDADFSSFHKVIFHWGRRGIRSQERNPRAIASTRPNGMDFIGCQWAGCTKYAGLFLGAAAINILGGDVEGCGYGPDDGPTWGFLFQDCGVQGGIGVNISGVYFEHNMGIADIWIISTDAPAAGYTAKTCVHNITGNDFKRLSNTHYTDHNIVFSNIASVAGLQKLNVVGNSFKNFNSYVPAAERQYVFFGGDARNASNFHFQGNFQQEALESLSQYTPFATGLGIAASPVTTITSGTVQQVPFNAAIYDADKAAELIAPYGIIAKETGIYQVSASLEFSANATGTRVLTLSRNGSGFVEDIRMGVSGSPTCCAVSRDVLLNKGDRINCTTYQDSGAGLTIFTNKSHFSLRMVAPA
ncbi:MAG: hypothetical protein [Caudoviricetes sp.]|nr:MAG: hypothetical protein [Caudoviricetes sp.]